MYNKFRTNVFLTRSWSDGASTLNGGAYYEKHKWYLLDPTISSQSLHNQPYFGSIYLLQELN